MLRPFLISRRNFIKHIYSLAIIPYDLLHLLPEIDRLDLTYLDVQVPRLILFPACIRKDSRPAYCIKAAVKLVSMTMVSSQGLVKVDFSNGEQLQFSPGESFMNKAQAPRKRVAVKSLISWILAALQRKAGGWGRVDFLRLQRQRVLERVTLGALFYLLKEMKQKPTANVTWASKEKKFIVG